MDVIDDDFEVAYHLFERLLPGAAFVAVDFEFTGLGTTRPSNLDTPEHRYAAARENATEFPPIQFGISVFRMRPPASSPDNPPALKPENSHSSTSPISSSSLATAADATANAIGIVPVIPSPQKKSAETAEVALKAEVIPPTVPTVTTSPPVAVVTSKPIPLAETTPAILSELATLSGQCHGPQSVASPAPAAQPAQALPQSPLPVSAPSHTPLSVAAPSPKTATPSSSRSSSCWFAIPFNFNIHPRAVYFPPSEAYPAIDKVFRLQASTVKFLGSHGFDFSRNFHHGISWLRPNDEDFLRRHVTDILRKRRNPRQCIHPAGISKEDAALVERVRKKIVAWIAGKNEDEVKLSKQDKSSSPTSPFPRITLLDYPSSNMSRRLIFEMIKEQFPRITVTVMRTYHGLKLRIVLHKYAKLAEQERAHTLKNEVDEVVLPAVGVRRIFDLLRKHRLPLVVHHGLMDLTKLYANFVGDLPPILSDFKTKFGEVFPHVFDTKTAMEIVCKSHSDVSSFLERERFAFAGMPEYLIAMREAVHARKLHHVSSIDTFVPTCTLRNADMKDKKLFGDGSEHLFIPESLEEWETDLDKFGFGRYSYHGGKDFKHEAGYDALETGKLFILIKELLGGGETFDNLWNKIHLSTCGGFKRIDIHSKEQYSDFNVFFNGNTVIVRGSYDEPGRDHHCRKVLRRLTKDTVFDENSDFVVVSRTIFIARLQNGDKGCDSFMPDEVGKVIENGKKLSLDISRYELKALICEDGESEGSHKRRRFA